MSLELTTLGTTKNTLRPEHGVLPLPWQTGQLRQSAEALCLRRLVSEPGLRRGLCQGGDPSACLRDQAECELCLVKQVALVSFPLPPPSSRSPQSEH